MAMNRATFPKDLQEGLNAHFGMIVKSYPEEWRQFLDMETSRKAFEEDVLEYGFGAASVKGEGEDTAEDAGGQGWVARYDHETVALKFTLTQEAIEDNLYASLGPKFAKGLARSLMHAKEIKAASLLNYAATSGYNGGDGVPLLSTAHPLQGGGTASNKLPTPADISETAIEDLLIQIRKCQDDRGTPMALVPLRLIIPPESEYTTIRITRSNLRSGVNENDINAIRAKGVFNSDPAVITRFTDSDAWGIKTDCPDGLKLFQRIAIQRWMTTDKSTGNVEYGVRERYSKGWSNWRSYFGSEGAA